MDLDPDEINPAIEMVIKEEPIVKEEPHDSMVIAIASTSTEVGINHSQASDEVKSENEDDELVCNLDSECAKEEVDCCRKKVKKKENSAENPASNSDVNDHVSPMATANKERAQSNKVGEGKKRSRQRKQNDRKNQKDQTANKEKKHKCQWCEYKSSLKGNLTRHILTHSGEKPFECDICSKTFTQNSHQARHMKVHSGQRPFECSVCLKSFSSKQGLNFHLRIHQSELKFECSKCGQRFSEKYTKNLHEIHCKICKYECYLCRYKSFRKSHVKFHMEFKHIGDKKFQCELCGKKFIGNFDYQRHLATHHEQFPHRCSKCRRGFPEEAELNGHERICRYRRYQCYICYKFLCNRENAKNHTKSQHTGERPFPCNNCGVRFFRKSNVNEHMKNVHGSKCVN